MRHPFGSVLRLLVLLTLLLSGCGNGTSSTVFAPPPEASLQATPQPSPDGPWHGLQQTTWAVPAENLRAYALTSGATQPVLLAQQTVLRFTEERRGYLIGTASVHLSTAVATTGLGPTPKTMALVGSVTPEGSLQLYLTASGVSTIQLIGTLTSSGPDGVIEAQTLTTGTARVMQMARFRRLADGQAPAAVSTPLSTDAATDVWAFLQGLTFYVPRTNLLAWVLSPKGTPLLPLNDQTVYTLDRYDNGYYWGPTQTTLSARSGVGSYGTSTSDLTLLGSVTPSGRVLLSFSPSDGSNPPVTGYGVMQRLDGQWTMLNQMASGGTPSITHWAYMLQLPAGGTPPSPAGPVDLTPVSSRWSFLEGTTWYVPDAWLPALSTAPGRPPIVVSDQTHYTIERFVNGYFFGPTTVQLTAPDGTVSTQSLDLAGSVTPVGGLFLSFTPSDGSPSTSGLGQMRTLGGQPAMENQMTSGEGTMLTHWAYMLSQ